MVFSIYHSILVPTFICFLQDIFFMWVLIGIIHDFEEKWEKTFLDYPFYLDSCDMKGLHVIELQVIIITFIWLHVVFVRTAS